MSSDRFQGLTAKDIPLGKYEVALACGGAQLSKIITVDRSEQLEILAATERLLISDPVKPRLEVTLKYPRPANEVWWIRLIGVYNNSEYSAVFEPPGGPAKIIDPEPGRYLVVVQSTNGYSCLLHVDLAEWTRSWQFNPATRTFQLDRFAHLVEDGNQQESNRWYEEIRLQKESLLRNLADAAEKK